MHIFKSKSNGVEISTLMHWLNEKSITEGGKFGISFKLGKRRKIKSFRLVKFGGANCETCGYWRYLIVKNGHGRFDFDYHLGAWEITINNTRGKT